LKRNDVPSFIGKRKKGVSFRNFFVNKLAFLELSGE